MATTDKRQGTNPYAPQVVIATDSLKGTISSQRAGELLTAAAQQCFPEAVCTVVPMADGGEGTADALIAAGKAERRFAQVHDPLGRLHIAQWAWLEYNGALIESAAASGLPLLLPSERRPLATSSRGTGELIAAALDAGVQTVTVALGGTATCDGGMGCLAALGARFFNKDHQELQGTGADLGRVHYIDLDELHKRLSGVQITLLCDVDNPLVGSQGAARVFAPQKGATSEEVDELERGMRVYSEALRAYGTEDPNVRGAGAAGGLAAGLMCFAHAQLASGVDYMIDALGLTQLLATADLCITGEGYLDLQTSHGKVVAGVAQACKRAHIPCVALVGGAESGADKALLGLNAVMTTVDNPMSLEYALSHAEDLYLRAAHRLFSLVALGYSLSQSQ